MSDKAMGGREPSEGLIIKGVGGFYYVEADGVIYECKARGVFRKRGITPLAGDRCLITTREDSYSSIDEILPRRNSLIRPAVANIDRLFIVVSAVRPSPNLTVIDRMTAMAEDLEIEPIIVFTKLDIASADETRDIYARAGYETVDIDYATGSGIERMRELMRDKISAFAGNSGVGKSTLLNAIVPELSQETGEISDKLGRGRHTTRSVELFTLPFGGRIADTPGFASFEGELLYIIDKEQLQYCFREFEPYLGECRFTGCAHLCEKGCAVVQAVSEGKIAPSRHESYCVMYDEAKNNKPWEQKNPKNV